MWVDDHALKELTGVIHGSNQPSEESVGSVMGICEVIDSRST